MQSQKNYYDVYSIPVTPHGYEGFEGEKRFRSVTPREVGSTDIFSNRWNLPNPQCLKLPSYLDLPKPLLYLSRMKDIKLFWLCVAVFRQHRQTVLGNSFGDCWQIANGNPWWVPLHRLQNNRRMGMDKAWFIFNPMWSVFYILCDFTFLVCSHGNGSI